MLRAHLLPRHTGVVASLLGLMSMLIGVGVAQAQTTTRVELSEFAFNPAPLTVRAGQPTTFELVNVGRFPHSMRIAGPNGEIQPEGGPIASGSSTTWTVNLSQPGTYTFWCPVGNHRAQGMESTIIVAGAQVTAPSALPRAGEADETPVGGILAVAGALLVGVGYGLRRLAAAHV